MFSSGLAATSMRLLSWAHGHFLLQNDISVELRETTHKLIYLFISHFVMIAVKRQSLLSFSHVLHILSTKHECYLVQLYSKEDRHFYNLLHNPAPTKNR